MSRETENDQQTDQDAVQTEETVANETQADSEQVSNEEIEQELLEEEPVSETEQLQQQVADANDNVLRIQAEMQNMRRRAERDVETVSYTHLTLPTT